MLTIADRAVSKLFRDLTVKQSGLYVSDKTLKQIIDQDNLDRKMLEIIMTNWAGNSRKK